MLLSKQLSAVVISPCVNTSETTLHFYVIPVYQVKSAMVNNSLQIGLCLSLSHLWQVPGKVLNLCNCWATAWFSAKWILEAFQSPLWLWWSHYELCHRHFIIWEKCWNIAREWLILYGSPTDRAGKSLRSWSIPLSSEEEVGMICSGEQKPSAGSEHVLTCSLITCFENCTCDILCGWWQWRAGSSLLPDTGSVFFQELKQTGVRSFWETLDRQGMSVDLWISEIKCTFLCYLIFLKWAWNQLEAQQQISLKAESHNSVYTKLYFLCCWFPKCFIMLPWEETKLNKWCQAEKQGKLYDFWVLFAWSYVENKFSPFAHL